MKLSEIDPSIFMGIMFVIIADEEGDNFNIKGQTWTKDDEGGHVIFEPETLTKRKWNALKQRLEPTGKFYPLEIVGYPNPRNRAK